MSYVVELVILLGMLMGFVGLVLKGSVLSKKEQRLKEIAIMYGYDWED